LSLTLMAPSCRRRLRQELTVLGILAYSFALVAQTANPGAGASSPEAKVAYFFAQNGSFVRLAADGQLTAYWNLSRTDGSSALLPICHEGSYAGSGCDLISDSLEAGEAGRLYGVLPTKAAPDDSGGREYQVVVFQLPDMRIGVSVPIPGVQLVSPSLLLTPDGQRLFVSYQDRSAEAKATEPTIVSVLDIYDATSLKKLSSMRESVATKTTRVPGGTLVHTVDLPLALLPQSYFSPDAGMIFNGLLVKTIANSTITDHRVNPLEKLSAGQKEQLTPFQTIYPGTQTPYLNFGAADSAAGKTVVSVANASRNQAAYWTVDLRTSEVSSLIVAPWGVVHLTPDARLLLIQEAELKHADGQSAPETYLKSKFWLYDVDTGKQVGEFTDAALAGSAFTNRLLCVSGSGKQFFFAVKDAVHIVRLPGGETSRVQETGMVDLPKAMCVRADR
jgi:hypothetical protein